MADLHGETVFLSASFPSGKRGERFMPYDPPGSPTPYPRFPERYSAATGLWHSVVTLLSHRLS